MAYKEIETVRNIFDPSVELTSPSILHSIEKSICEIGNITIDKQRGVSSIFHCIEKNLF